MTDGRVFTKCAWRLIPFITLLYLVNFIDRVNVGFAALTMNKDLGYSPTVFGFGAGVFLLRYLLFQVPAAPSPARLTATPLGYADRGAAPLSFASLNKRS